MIKKQIIVFVIAFVLSVWIYSSIKNFFIKHFSLIEKNQTLILKELKKINGIAKISPTESPFSNIQNLGKIKEELAKIKNKVENQNEILGLDTFESTPSATPTVTALNFVSISDRRWQSIDVYQENNSASRIIGQAIYGKTYPFFKKEGSYYYIQLNENSFGWILAQFVKEY